MKHIRIRHTRVSCFDNDNHKNRYNFEATNNPTLFIAKTELQSTLAVNIVKSNSSTQYFCAKAEPES